MALRDAAAEQEIRAVVDSVFPFAMLAQFITLAPEERQLQLRELPLVTLGIYMYNRAKGLAAAAPLQAALDAHAADGPALQRAIADELGAKAAVLHAYSGPHCAGPLACNPHRL